ncbi:TIR domain-containing protein [Actinoplanes sp. TRM 88003]|uniref:TIR domain-containing protein n=1 Tax=Paractinoplanes aksuensis TaxID=2939490 RepID=A0ABT1E3I7_9ACTN|nr:TIR domain-containing protein [Actinoplanes aksuensis]MCO8277697.1 TIR domain-containing protein [Actinoplanes aksuensis]
MADDGRSYAYDAFLSYSHGPDAQLAARLQRRIALAGLPSYRPARRRVFRDVTEMAFSPDLRSAIDAALRDSRWLVVVASTRSLDSEWVRAEVALWRAERSPQHMVIVDVDGFPRPGHEWLTDGVPAEQIVPLDGDNTAVRVAALLDSVPADTLGAVVARRRRRRTVGLAAAAVVVVLAFVASVTAAVVSRRYAAAADRDRRLAVSSALAVRSEALQLTDPQLAGLLAVAAHDRHASPRTEHALANAAQEQLAVPPYTDVALTSSPFAGAVLGDGFVLGAADGTLTYWAPGSSPVVAGRLPEPLAAVVDGGDSAVLAVGVRGYVAAVAGPGEVRKVGVVAVSADVTAAARAGGMLVLACSDGTVSSLDAGSLAMRSTVRMGKVTALAGDPRTSTVYAAGADTMSAWSVPALTRRWQTKPPRPVTGLAVATDRDAVATADAVGRVRIYRGRTGTIVEVPNEELVPGHDQGVEVAIGWWQQGETFLSSGADRVLTGVDPSTGLVSARINHSALPAAPVGFVGGTGGVVIILPRGTVRWVPNTPDKYNVAALAPVFTEDAGVPKVGGEVVYARALLGVSPRRGVVLQAMTGSGAGAQAVAFRPDQAAATAAMRLPGPGLLLPGTDEIVMRQPDGSIVRHALTDGRPVGRLRTAGPVRLLRAAPTSSGWLLAAADGVSPRAGVFRPGDSGRLDLDTGRSAAVTDLAVLPTGRVATIDTTGAVDLFRVDPAVTRIATTRSTGPVRLVVVDGRDQLALTERGGRVRLLDGATLADQGAFAAAGEDVVALAVDGDTLVVAAAYTGLAIYDPVTLEARTPSVSRGHAVIRGLARIGGHVLAVYEDGGLVRVRWDTVALRARVCAWVGRMLTDDEARRFEVDGQRPCRS